MRKLLLAGIAIVGLMGSANATAYINPNTHRFWQMHCTVAAQEHDYAFDSSDHTIQFLTDGQVIATYNASVANDAGGFNVHIAFTNGQYYDLRYGTIGVYGSSSYYFNNTANGYSPFYSSACIITRFWD